MEGSRTKKDLAMIGILVSKFANIKTEEWEVGCDYISIKVPQAVRDHVDATATACAENCTDCEKSEKCDYRMTDCLNTVLTAMFQNGISPLIKKSLDILLKELENEM